MIFVSEFGVHRLRYPSAADRTVNIIVCIIIISISRWYNYSRAYLFITIVIYWRCCSGGGLRITIYNYNYCDRHGSSIIITL